MEKKVTSKTNEEKAFITYDFATYAVYQIWFYYFRQFLGRLYKGVTRG